MSKLSNLAFLARQFNHGGIESRATGEVFRTLASVLFGGSRSSPGNVRGFISAFLQGFNQGAHHAVPRRGTPNVGYDPGDDTILPPFFPPIGGDFNGSGRRFGTDVNGDDGNRGNGSGGGNGGSGGSGNDDEDDYGPEREIETLPGGRGGLGYDLRETEATVQREIRTPQSSNVWSYTFERESRTQVILYVTFRSWHPGQRGKGNGPGPTYAYYNVPMRVYQQFNSAAQVSAGGAVWDYLRVRGQGNFGSTQYQYRLVAGSIVHGSQDYVPRKATQLGFKRRSVTEFGVGRRGFVRSTLPERAFPDRGTPNRGTPNNGAP